MKSRGFELPVDRPSFSFLAALKLLLLTALLILFLNATFSLYSSISTRYYYNPHPPFIRISSSSSSSSSSFSSTSSSTSSSPSYSSSSSSSSSLLEDESVSSSPLQAAPSPVSGPPSSTSIESSPSSYSSLNSTLSPVASVFNPHSSSYIMPAPSSPPTISPPPPPPISLLKPSAEPIAKAEKPSPSNYSHPMNSPSSSPSSPRPNKRIPKGCDLSKGEWIRDPNAPYYTNSTCYTIQEHQNCMKYGRPDLSFLKWRWKPDGCELPLLEPAAFLELMRGKNLAFIGDSLARNQMQSLMCLLSRVEYPEEIWPSADNVTQMWYRSYNFTVWAFWSPFLIRARENLTGGGGGGFGMWNLYLDEVDPLWQPRLGGFDHIVFNTGNWYTRPAHFHEKRRLVGCHYCIVKKVPFMSIYKAHRRAFRTALDAVVGNREGFRGVTVVRTVSPSHFEGGEWNKGGDCGRTAPSGRSKAKLKGMDLELYKDQMREFWKAKWEGGEKGLEFRLLDTTGAMLMRPDGHPSRYGHWPHEERVLYNDCVHWCLPGPVDMWNDMLFQILSI